MVEFRTAITRPDVSAISDLNEILVKNRVSDIKTTACWGVRELITESTADIQFISLSYQQTDSGEYWDSAPWKLHYLVL